MIKNLFAFFLACLAVTSLLAVWTILSGGAEKYQRPIKVTIRSNTDTHDIVSAVESLHRPDIDIQTQKNPPRYPSLFGAPYLALGAMLLTALVLFFYKKICQWMGIPPTI